MIISFSSRAQTIKASSYNQDMIIMNNSDVNWTFGGYNSGTNFWMQATYYDVNDGLRGFRVFDKNLQASVFSTNRYQSLIPHGALGVGGSPEFSTKLHVFGDMAIGSDTQTALITGPGNGGAIQIKSNRAFGGNEDRFLRLGWVDNLKNFQPRLTINNAGNVGIGTTNPQSLLSVKGKISAQEVQVTLSGWSDFVFFDSYKLRPLSEVETFIQENKHLPDVPSATVVEKEGVNLGEMDAILLRKIEELTLYVIDQNKRMNILEAENQQLKQQIQENIKK